MKKNILSLIVILLVVGSGWWIWQKLSTPLPGESVPDLGRNHVSDGTQVQYNSNPPTSGPHYEEWTKAGVYDKQFSDGHLVHSLEHGYVVISYNCTKQVFSFHLPFFVASAHEENPDASPSAQASPSAELSGSQWESEDCKKLISQLADVYEKEGKKKIIIVPRPSLDTRIALTAWTRIDKFDNFDEGRIKKFIETFRNRGPEKTVE
ncbi:MAG: DUF3105 domain-containing protein [Candidatus Blackburnbacteria bacterium]|nr:DUF3105 domain-containing protein [Candidatus Blackburnbacteria bacterium]